MAKFVVMGAGLGGMSAAYELRDTLGKSHEITLVGLGETFGFTPSNPWLAVVWRKREVITVPVAKHVGKHGIRYINDGVTSIDAEANLVVTGSGESVDYDYLLICTGPKLAFDEVLGTGPENGHTQSICTTAHAQTAWVAYEAFLKNPGPIVVGAVQGASCFGPGYEFAMIVDADLRRRKLRDKVPMHYVSSEPYVGHMGLGGVGDSKGLMESELRQRHIKWTVNAKVAEVRDGEMTVIENDAQGQPLREQVLPVQVLDAAASVQGRGRGRRGGRAVQSAWLRDRRKAPTQPQVPQHLFGRCLRRHSAGRGHAGTNRRAKDRLHDRIDGHHDRAQYPGRTRWQVRNV